MTTQWPGYDFDDRLFVRPHRRRAWVVLKGTKLVGEYDSRITAHAVTRATDGARCYCREVTRG